MSYFLKQLDRIESIIAMLLLAIIVICVFSAAMLRSFGYPIIWSVEIAQLLFIWLCMLGASLTLRRNEHVGVDILVRRLSRNHHDRLEFVLSVLIAAALVVLIIYGVRLTLLNPERTLGTVSFPYASVTAAIPVGATLMLLTVIDKVIKLGPSWRKSVQGDDPL